MMVRKWLGLVARVVQVAQVAQVGVLGVLGVGSGGCDRDAAAKVSERHALAHVEELAKRVDLDVEEVRRGLPRGAKALGRVWDGQANWPSDPAALRRALDQVRNADRDLAVAKSTFFALANDKGAVLGSDQEPERLSGTAVFDAFPSLAGALSGTTVETRGALAEAAGVRTGGDEQWVTGAPVRDAAGVVRGVYLTGWSMRRFAYHLEEVLKHDLVTAALRSGATEAKQPLIYVFVFAGPKVYGAPVTPLVNTQALEGLDLVGKTAGGLPFHTTIEITGRGYGVASGRTPKLGADVGVAVLRSET